MPHPCVVTSLDALRFFDLRETGHSVIKRRCDSGVINGEDGAVEDVLVRFCSVASQKHRLILRFIKEGVTVFGQ